MTMRALLFVALFFQLTAVALPQDPLKVAPKSYKLQFENEWVKVTRVHYGPHAKIPVHDHSRWPAAYVYLNDSGPIIFRHTDWEHPVLTRPATKTGNFRLSPTRETSETHEVENPTATPSDFLRIEFKTRPDNQNPLRGRFRREQYPARANFLKVQFENEQVRVTRLACARRQSCDVVTGPSEPALLVAVSAARLKHTGAGGAVKQTALEAGRHVWLDGGGQTRLENLGATPLEFLRFDFKTKPVNLEASR